MNRREAGELTGGSDRCLFLRSLESRGVMAWRMALNGPLSHCLVPADLAGAWWGWGGMQAHPPHEATAGRRPRALRRPQICWRLDVRHRATVRRPRDCALSSVVTSRYTAVQVGHTGTGQARPVEEQRPLLNSPATYKAVKYLPV